MELTNSFGKFLEGLRGKMSLRKAANKSGLSHAYIRDLELGRNRSTNDIIKPSPDTLRKLSRAYDYPYTELLVRAGYLEHEGTAEHETEVALHEVWYVEFGVKDICYHRSGQKLEQRVHSLIDFTNLVESLVEQGFVKLDAHLFVNIHHIKKYVPHEGKLYFDEKGELPSVTIAALPQKKYHQSLLDAVAANTGTDVSLAFPKQLEPQFFS